MSSNPINIDIDPNSIPEAAITRVECFSYLIHVVLAVFYSSTKPIVLRKSEANRLYIFI